MSTLDSFFVTLHRCHEQHNGLKEWVGLRPHYCHISDSIYLSWLNRFFQWIWAYDTNSRLPMMKLKLVYNDFQKYGTTLTITNPECLIKSSTELRPNIKIDLMGKSILHNYLSYDTLINYVGDMRAFWYQFPCRDIFGKYWYICFTFFPNVSIFSKYLIKICLKYPCTKNEIT